MAGQVWGTSSLGGYLANPKISAKFRYSALPIMRFRQFARVEKGFGKKKGDIFLFDRASAVETAGGPINELERMPETKFAISQGQLVVTEYGNSIPWTGKLNELSEFNVSDIVMKRLRDDMAKTLDAACGAVFQGAKIKYVPTGTAGSPTGTFETTLSTTATRDVSTFDIKEIVDALKSTYWAEKYDTQNFFCIASTKFLRKIKDDADWEDAAKYGDPERLFSGEVGKYYGVRFIEETNVLSNTLGSTSYNGEAIFFGDDPVVEGVVVPEELRQKIATDYGRDHGLAWYFLGGWARTWDSSTPGEVKIIHVTSA